MTEHQTTVICPKCGSPPPSLSGCMADGCPHDEIINMMCKPPAAPVTTVGAELKPCPFCGGSLEITKHFRDEAWRAVHRCPHVGPIMFDWTSRDRIEKKWNIRYGE